MKSSRQGVVAAASRRANMAIPALPDDMPLPSAGIAAKQRTDARYARFWYYVAPQLGGDAWGVSFEGKLQASPYHSRADALKAACFAAHAMHRKDHAAAGVRVRVGDDWREAVRFGAPPDHDDRGIEGRPR